jgi:membrane-associated protease RseP (regulator of RpoE activity)
MILMSHGHGDTDMSGLFEKFYLVQCVWEDVMADSITGYLSSPEAKGKKLLVFVGGGHIIYHFGVPKRVYRSNHLPYLTIETYEKRALNPDKDHPLFAGDIPLQPADYIKVVQLPEPKKTKIVLGVMIRNLKKGETEEEKKDKDKKEQKYKVVMDSVREDSPAGKAGLQAGDIILSMDNETINRVFDVIYHVRQKKSGDTCQLEILREEENITVDVTFFESKK